MGVSPNPLRFLHSKLTTRFCFLWCIFYVNDLMNEGVSWKALSWTICCGYPSHGRCIHRLPHSSLDIIIVVPLSKRIFKWLPEFVKGLLGCRCYGCYGSCVLGILYPLGFNKANYKMLFLAVNYFHFE